MPLDIPTVQCTGQAAGPSLIKLLLLLTGWDCVHTRLDTEVTNKVLLGFSVSKYQNKTSDVRQSLVGTFLVMQRASEKLLLMLTFQSGMLTFQSGMQIFQSGMLTIQSGMFLNFFVSKEKKFFTIEIL